MPLSVAGCGRLQLGVPHWATSVNYFKLLIIDPTFCGSRFPTGRLLAIEHFTIFFQMRFKKRVRDLGDLNSPGPRKRDLGYLNPPGPRKRDLGDLNPPGPRKRDLGDLNPNGPRKRDLGDLNPPGPRKRYLDDQNPSGRRKRYLDDQNPSGRRKSYGPTGLPIPAKIKYSIFKFFFIQEQIIE